MTFRHEQHTATGTWILVADRGRARILRQLEDAPSELEEIKVLDCPEAGLPPHQQVSDQPGYFKGRGDSLDAGDPKTDFKHRTAQRFAREIVQQLQEGRQRGDFGHLILVAAPMFLGVLKSHLDEPLTRLVQRSIDRDYTSLSLADLAARLETN